MNERFRAVAVILHQFNAHAARWRYDEERTQEALKVGLDAIRALGVTEAEILDAQDWLEGGAE